MLYKVLHDAAMLLQFQCVGFIVGEVSETASGCVDYIVRGGSLKDFHYEIKKKDNMYDKI